ncbi:polysaccharide biosynthesis tyrosine autokinase [Myxococcota bacterium]|nr:polysaccharide biosynthesis tyrosine autokinase [Myxococcota bacterium]
MSEDMDRVQPPGFQLEDIVEVLERRRWWLLTAMTLGLIVAFGAYLLLPARYESGTTILVEPQGVPEAYVKSTVTVAVEHRLHTLHERVTSHASLNALVDRIGLARMDPSGRLSREEVMNSVRSGLAVNVMSRSKAPVFEITFSAPDPDVAALVVKELTNQFIAENLKDRTQQATATAHFLDDELSRLRGDVTAQEKKIRDFNYSALGSLPSQLDSNLHELDRLNLELASNLEAQVATTGRIAVMRGESRTGFQRGSAERPDELGTLVSALRSARQELLESRSVYTDEHPNVKRLRSEISDLELRLSMVPANEGDDSAPDPIDPALRAEIESSNMALASHRRSEARIRERIETVQRRVDETPAREEEHRALTRDYEDLSETYRALLGKKYDAALARNLEVAQKGERFKLLRPAQIPSAPAWPDLKLLLPIGAGAGLGIALLVIGMLEVKNPAFRSVERLSRAIGIPVFASIPRIDNDQIFEKPPSELVDPKLVAHTAPDSSPAEQYRGFLPTFLESDDCKVMLVTSAARGDGKTLTTMNLAATLASNLNRRVLVIDADLRRPHAHRVMRQSRHIGFSNVLLDKEKLGDCVVETPVPNLWLLSAGEPVRNPLKLFTDKAFLRTIEEARQNWDIILIDSPPLLPVVDTRILRSLADMVLFVIRADATPRDAVLRSMKELRDVAGVIFNQVSPGSFRRYYYYDPYSRYAYGDPVSEELEGGLSLG